MIVSSLVFAALAGAPQETYKLMVPEPSYQRPRNRVAGDKALRIMFLRTSFANDPQMGVSRHSEEEVNRIGTALNDYFKIQSYGAMSVAKFEISPVVGLGNSSLYERTTKDGKEVPQKERKNTITEAISAANKQLNREIRTEFDMICVLVNASPAGGKIAPQGVAALATGPQTSIFFAAKPEWRVFAHEIGHNFGFGHGWSVRAKNDQESLAAEREFTEYGDPVTPMGRGYNSYTVVERYRMGWIGSKPDDIRFIRQFEPGPIRFMSYDRPDAKGCVGGYITGDFGVELKELVSKRDGGDNGGEVPSVENPGPQRLWLSVISRRNLADGKMLDLPSPLLVAHLSSLVPSSKGAAKAGMTVSLDLKPARARVRREPMTSRGLAPGQSGEVSLKSGQKVKIRFDGYDSKTHIAQISLDAPR